MATIYDTILLRRGLAANRTNITPQQGEPLYTTDTQQFYIGDGVTPGGNLVSAGSGGSGISTAGVSSLNGLLNNIIISGFAGVNVVPSGQYLLISVTGILGSSGLTSGQASSLFYPLIGNPSGFSTGINVSNFITTGQSGQFQPSGNYYPTSNPSGFITSGAILTGNYYPANNPSGFITGFNSGQYITTGQTGQFASSLLINNLTGATGNYYTNNNPSGFLTSSGNASQLVSVNGYLFENISGTSNVNINPIGATQSYTVVLSSGAAPYTGNRFLQASGSQSGDLWEINVTYPSSAYPVLNIYDSASSGLLVSTAGNGVSGSTTYQFSFNGSNWIHYAKGAVLMRTLGSGVQPAFSFPLDISGGLVSVNGSLFYPQNNPSGYITGLNTGNFITLGFTGITITGNITTNIKILNSLNTLYVNYSGTGAFTGNFILNSGLNSINRIIATFPISGSQIFNVYNLLGSGVPIFTWTGDNTTTQIYSEYSFSGTNWNLDNANFIN